MSEAGYVITRARPVARRYALEATASSVLVMRIALAAAFALAVALRLWDLNRYGYNSDEAVYAGQAASIANHPELKEFFPTFRAHPLLFQTVLSLGFHLGGVDLFGRIMSAAFGVGTIYIVYRLGRVLYGHQAGVVAALLLAVMPYHVLVTRQVLLDGPMVFFSTLTLLLIAQYAVTERPAWLYAAAATMGLTFLAKETSVLLVGAVYAFFALSPEVRIRFRQVVVAGMAMGVVVASFPLSTAFGGKPETGGQYLAWQLFRRPNHDWIFYASEVPKAVGYLVCAAALVGLWRLRGERSWRERLLLSWIGVPVFFFELWPVKGFQYLLPVAPAVAVLAARALVLRSPRSRRRFALLRSPWFRPAVITVVTGSLLLTSWTRIQPSTAGTFLAGSGGVPAGRETGHWIARHVPEGANMLTIGPSMANIIQYYGRRKAYGLSVSPNPLRRNPAYEPVLNPDLRIRTSELQYVVWDSFSANRSPFFSDKLLRYADRYNGHIVHTESVEVASPSGRRTLKPLIVVYEVRP